MESPPRHLVSLAPSSTATLSALGIDDRVVGVTAHCDADAAVVGGWLSPDYDRLDALDPDLVFTCDDLQADVRDDLRSRGYDVCHVAPRTLEDVFEAFETLGAAVGRPDAAAALVDRARSRLDEIAADAPADPPTVYCEEWSDPPMAAGNWIPDLVRVAGGRYPFLDAGERSREVDESTVAAADPDHVVLHVCGHGERPDPSVVTDRWSLDAAVHVVDDRYLNRPGPSLIEGAERLAACLR